MKKFTLIVLAAGLAVTAACTASTKDALPQGSDKFPTTATTAAAGLTVEGLSSAECDAYAAKQTGLNPGQTWIGSVTGSTCTVTPAASGAAKTTPTTEAAPAASTCDVTREALLTGTQAEILASMKALMADKTADATAREYADYYVNRDKASPDMREMDIGLIRMSCSI